MVNNEVQHDSENNDPDDQKLGIDKELTVRRLWSIVNADRFALWYIALSIISHRVCAFCLVHIRYTKRPTSVNMCCYCYGALTRA